MYMCLLYFMYTWYKIDDLEINSAHEVYPKYFKIRLIYYLKIFLFSGVGVFPLFVCSTQGGQKMVSEPLELTDGC